jgi:DNA replication protein DnaC
MDQSGQNTTNLLDTLNPEEEYIKDNLIYCKKCNTPRMCEGLFGRMVRCICKCQAEERDREEELARQKERLRMVDKIKKASLLGEKYKDVTFANTEKPTPEFTKIYNRCKRYCEVAREVLDKGIGIYLFGSKGAGKSHLTACMANALMDNYYSVLYTNFSEISKYIRSTFNKTTETEYDFLERLSSIDFLFIDDFGTELVTKNDQDLWLQEKVFEVINKRYNNNKPIIFTSNYSLRQLYEERGIADKTIDRINEMCEIMKLEGNSFRRKVKEEREKLF